MTGRTFLALITLVAGAGLGLVVGFGVMAECPGGPVPGLAKGFATLAIGAVAGLMVIVVVVLALQRRGGFARVALLMAAIGLAAGYAAGLTFARDPCPPGGRLVDTAGVASLRLGEPYRRLFEGPVSCSVDAIDGRLIHITGGTNRSDLPAWMAGELGVNFDLPVGSRPPGDPFFDLTLSQPGREWGYRATESEQIDLTAGNGLAGSMTFQNLPLLEETRPPDITVADSIDGQLTWTCEAPTDR